MRKWMRERLTRRKKGPEKAAGDTTPAPLQPAFYDNEVVSQPARISEDRGEEHSEPEASEPQAREIGNVAEPTSVQSGAGDAGDAMRRRRRRGRGGRGRSRAGQT